MTLDLPSGCPVDAYSGFVRLLLDIFHLVCNSLSELRYLVRIEAVFPLEFKMRTYTCILTQHFGRGLFLTAFTNFFSHIFDIISPDVKMAMLALEETQDTVPCKYAL